MCTSHASIRIATPGRRRKSLGKPLDRTSVGIPPCCDHRRRCFSESVTEIEVTIQLRANEGTDAISARIESPDGSPVEVDGWMALLSVLENQLDEARRKTRV